VFVHKGWGAENAQPENDKTKKTGGLKNDGLKNDKRKETCRTACVLRCATYEVSDLQGHSRSLATHNFLRSVSL